jgi:hypothetical protein
MQFQQKKHKTLNARFVPCGFVKPVDDFTECRIPSGFSLSGVLSERFLLVGVEE